jgi:hypothetical protein
MAVIVNWPAVKKAVAQGEEEKPRWLSAQQGPI